MKISIADVCSFLVAIVLVLFIKVIVPCLDLFEEMLLPEPWKDREFKLIVGPANRNTQSDSYLGEGSFDVDLRHRSVTLR